jgi:hypothetical protein
MASVHNYTFDNLTRMGDDQCTSTQRAIQNKEYGNYLTYNPALPNCGMKKPIEFATNQPNIQFKGGIGSNVGAGGCVVDQNSDLMIGTVQTRPKCRISLFQRPFLTVPYLGKGPSRPTLESALQQGDHVSNKKSCNTVTETPFMREATPLIPSLKETIQDPNNLVEGVAARGWIRGGLPTRDLVRDQDYFQRHGPKN